MTQPHLALAEPDSHLAGEGDGRPGQPGDAFHRAEQAREATDLGIHVLPAALDDQGARHVRGDDLGPGIGGRPEHADGMVVAEQHVADRLVGQRPHARDEALRHDRGCLRIDNHHRIIADDDPGIGVALGGEGDKGPGRFHRRRWSSLRYRRRTRRLCWTSLVISRRASGHQSGIRRSRQSLSGSLSGNAERQSGCNRNDLPPWFGTFEQGRKTAAGSPGTQR